MDKKDSVKINPEFNLGPKDNEADFKSPEADLSNEKETPNTFETQNPEPQTNELNKLETSPTETKDQIHSPNSKDQKASEEQKKLDLQEILNGGSIPLHMISELNETVMESNSSPDTETLS